MIIDAIEDEKKSTFYLASITQLLKHLDATFPVNYIFKPYHSILAEPDPNNIAKYQIPNPPSTPPKLVQLRTSSSSDLSQVKP